MNKPYLAEPQDLPGKKDMDIYPGSGAMNLSSHRC